MPQDLLHKSKRIPRKPPSWQGTYSGARATEYSKLAIAFEVYKAWLIGKWK